MKSPNKLLGFVIALQVLVLMGQWTTRPTVQSAHADVQLPNPSERQLAILDELKTLNGKMDRLIGVMTSGDAKVEITKLPNRAK